MEDQLKIKPIYKTFPGWKCSTNGIKNIEALPENAKNYIFALEDFIGAKVSSVSTSPERKDTILIENPFESGFSFVFPKEYDLHLKKSASGGFAFVFA